MFKLTTLILEREIRRIKGMKREKKKGKEFLSFLSIKTHIARVILYLWILSGIFQFSNSKIESLNCIKFLYRDSIKEPVREISFNPTLVIFC
ncbi:MAG: hypothetical protein DRP02_14525, partial [Candidatus Gerdarchaeota archaeon]